MELWWSFDGVLMEMYLGIGNFLRSTPTFFCFAQMTPIPYRDRAQIPENDYSVVTETLVDGVGVIAEGRVIGTEECNVDECSERCGQQHVVVEYDEPPYEEVSYVLRILTKVQEYFVIFFLSHQRRHWIIVKKWTIHIKLSCRAAVDQAECPGSEPRYKQFECYFSRNNIKLLVPRFEPRRWFRVVYCIFSCVRWHIFTLPTPLSQPFLKRMRRGLESGDEMEGDNSWTQLLPNSKSVPRFTFRTLATQIGISTNVRF